MRVEEWLVGCAMFVTCQLSLASGNGLSAGVRWRWLDFGGDIHVPVGVGLCVAEFPELYEWITTKSMSDIVYETLMRQAEEWRKRLSRISMFCGHCRFSGTP